MIGLFRGIWYFVDWTGLDLAVGKRGLVKLGLLKRLCKKRYDLDQLLLTERHSVNNIAGANNFIGFYYWIIWPVSGEVFCSVLFVITLFSINDLRRVKQFFSHPQSVSAYTVCSVQNVL